MVRLAAGSLAGGAGPDAWAIEKMIPFLIVLVEQEPGCQGAEAASARR
jgi:hypothetical protein